MVKINSLKENRPNSYVKCSRHIWWVEYCL